MKPRRRPLALVLVLAAVATTVRAQAPDHLKCYKVRDPLPKATYVADVAGLEADSGCQIRVPGKLFCVGATKTNIAPSPPGAVPGPDAGRFVCYKMKCPRGGTGYWFTDQFGARLLTVIGARMLCAPEPPPVTTTSTSTTIVTTTITNTLPPCLPDGASCTPGGTMCCLSSCIGGICTHPSSSTTTTSTVACSANGAACSVWYACCSGTCSSGFCAP